MMDVTRLRLVAKSLYRNLNPRSTLDRPPCKNTERLLGILQSHHVDLTELRQGGDVVTLMCAVCEAVHRSDRHAPPE